VFFHHAAESCERCAGIDGGWKTPLRSAPAASRGRAIGIRGGGLALQQFVEFWHAVQRFEVGIFLNMAEILKPGFDRRLKVGDGRLPVPRQQRLAIGRLRIIVHEFVSSSVNAGGIVMKDRLPEKFRPRFFEPGRSLGVFSLDHHFDDANAR